jgi:hypothetical protein
VKLELHIILSLTHTQQHFREREREMEDIEEGENGGGGEEEVLGSSLTMEKVAAAKKFIENHYRAQMKNIQDRKERYYQTLFLIF